MQLFAETRLSLLCDPSKSRDLSRQITQNGAYNYAISSFSIYKNKDAIAIAGNTSPTSGTRIEGR